MTGPSSTGPLTHGFLFADLRGYSAFAEAHGDAAAADLLDRYRLLVRAVLDELGGAEIKTEGDSFYVVFPSASRAVAAGLAIVERAADANTPDSASPIRVGIGIHAGEAEERAEGFVGTAVNIAARVCAQARPGEVLVTETVRALTRTSGRYGFTARGRPTLKGIAEPIALFAVGPAPTGTGIRSDATASSVGLVAGSRTRLVGGLILLSVVIVLAAVGVVGMRGGASGPAPSGTLALGPASPSTRASASVPSTSPLASGPRAFHTGRLESGSYVTNLFEPRLGLSVPSGWSGTTERPNYLEMSPFGIENEGLAFITPSIGFVPCSTTDYTPLPTRREDLVDWLTANPGLSVKIAGTVALGDVEAVELEVGLGDGCHGAQVQPLFLITKLTGFTDPDDRWTITRGPASPVFVMDVGGKAVVAMLGAPPAKLADFTRDAKIVLSSLQITP